MDIFDDQSPCILPNNDVSISETVSQIGFRYDDVVIVGVEDEGMATGICEMEDREDGVGCSSAFDT